MEKNKKKFRPIMVDEQLHSQIAFIAKLTKQSQNQVLKSIIGKMFSIVACFNEQYDVWYDVFEQIRETNIIIQVYGRPSMINGEHRSIPSLTDNENDLIDEKILKLDMDALAETAKPKTEKIKVTQEFPILGDLGIPKVDSSVKIEGKVKRTE